MLVEGCQCWGDIKQSECFWPLTLEVHVLWGSEKDIWQTSKPQSECRLHVASQPIVKAAHGSGLAPWLAKLMDFWGTMQNFCSQDWLLPEYCWCRSHPSLVLKWKQGVYMALMCRVNPAILALLYERVSTCSPCFKETAHDGTPYSSMKCMDASVTSYVCVMLSGHLAAC